MPADDYVVESWNNVFAIRASRRFTRNRSSKKDLYKGIEWLKAAARNGSGLAVSEIVNLYMGRELSMDLKNNIADIA